MDPESLKKRKVEILDIAYSDIGENKVLYWTKLTHCWSQTIHSSFVFFLLLLWFHFSWALKIPKHLFRRKLDEECFNPGGGSVSSQFILLTSLCFQTHFFGNRSNTIQWLYRKHMFQFSALTNLSLCLWK